MLGYAESKHPELISREIFFEELQPMWLRHLSVTDGQTDRRLAVAIRYSALRSIAR